MPFEPKQRPIIRLSPPERRELQARARAHSIREEASQRAQIIYLNPPAHAAVFSQVHVLFTPTYSSWLTQIEPRFSKIERDLIACKAFHGVKDLARTIIHYMRHYSKQAKPFKRSYRNTANRITTVSHSRVTMH
jgi:hypothetical protein